MRPRPSVLRSRVCLGGEAQQAAAGPSPIPGERTRAADACRSEPPISRPRPPRDGSGSDFGCTSRPTARTGADRRPGGATRHQRRYRALDCLLPLRKSRLQHGPPISNSSVVQTPDQSRHRQPGPPTSANSYGFRPALTPKYRPRPECCKASFRTERWGLSATVRFWTGLPSC